MSFQIAIDPNRRAATRFLGKVRRGLQKIFVDNPDLTRTEVARAIDVHRSVITRQLNGRSDISVGRVAEIAWAAGYRATIDFEKIGADVGCNRLITVAPAYSPDIKSVTGSSNEVVKIKVQKQKIHERVAMGAA